jgi:hypothetical protein
MNLIQQHVPCVIWTLSHFCLTSTVSIIRFIFFSIDFNLTQFLDSVSYYQRLRSVNALCVKAEGCRRFDGWSNSKHSLSLFHWRRNGAIVNWRWLISISLFAIAYSQRIQKKIEFRRVLSRAKSLLETFKQEVSLSYKIAHLQWICQ